MDKVYHLRRLGPNRYLSIASGSRSDPLEVRIEDTIMHPLVSGGEAKRYTAPETDTYILFPYERTEEDRMALIPSDRMAAEYPDAWRYLRSHEDALRRRESGAFDDDEWHRFGRTQNLDKQDTSKLIVAQTVPAMRVCFDEVGDKYVNNVRVNGILPAEGIDPWFLLGVLNGPIVDFVFRRIAKPKDGGYFEANRQFIAPLPIPNATRKQRTDIAARARELQRLHSERRDTLSRLRRLIEQQPRRKRRVDFLFPHIMTVRDRDGDSDRARKDYETEIAAEMETIEQALHPDVTLEANFDAGELVLRADGAPIIEGIRLAQAEGVFIAAQWNASADAFVTGGRMTAKRLTDDLRNLIVTDNQQVHAQLIALQESVRTSDADIATAEAAMNERLVKLYKLSPRERRLVEAG